MSGRFGRVVVVSALTLFLVAACSEPVSPTATPSPAAPTAGASQPGGNQPLATSTTTAQATALPQPTPTPPPSPTSTALPRPTATVTASPVPAAPAVPAAAPTGDLPSPGKLPTPPPSEKTVPPPIRSEGEGGATTSAEATARLEAVRAYYDLLARKAFEPAYAALSPAFQRLNPFDRWSSGYAGLTGLTYTATASADGAVAVTVTTREANPSGGETVRKYAGRWLLVYAAERGQWLLERAEIASLNN